MGSVYKYAHLPGHCHVLQIYSYLSFGNCIFITIDCIFSLCVVLFVWLFTAPIKTKTFFTQTMARARTRFPFSFYSSDIYTLRLSSCLYRPISFCMFSSPLYFGRVVVQYESAITGWCRRWSCRGTQRTGTVVFSLLTAYQGRRFALVSHFRHVVITQDITPGQSCHEMEI